MRRTFTLLVSVFFTVAIFSQAPEKMSYQAVIRDVSNHLVTTQIGMRISILQGSESGIAKYVETQTPTPNANGLVSIEIGSGTFVSGVSFSAIDWSDGPYFIKTETAVAAPLTTYTIEGTSQLLSVPYALHAKTVASYPETDPVFIAHPANGITSTNITNWTTAFGWGNHASAGYLTSFTETDPTVKAINGIVKSDGNTISAATAGTDYLTPTGSAATLTGFPKFNQSTTGSAASFTGSLVGEVTGTQGATVVTNDAVIGKVLTGFTSGAGTVVATDNILQAIQKLNGNNPMHYIGESYGGGIVFYVYDNGQHGLIAATADQGTGVVWTNTAFESTVSNAVRDGINGGLANTERIIIQAGAGSYAAQLCANYKGGNYADWYLPSRYELNLLYLQKAVVGGFANFYYWSSTEGISSAAWTQLFSIGDQACYNKFGTINVRAIRAF